MFYFVFRESSDLRMRAENTSTAVEGAWRHPQSSYDYNNMRHTGAEE